MKASEVWQGCLNDVDYIGALSAPRGKRVKEIIGHSYSLPMISSVITLADRKMNYGFMFAEAAWIVSGSNWLDQITSFMKRYADFSDDGLTLNGAYGPKILDQIMYIVSTIEKDSDTRQAVLNIWREKPGVSKDIPCTINMQFLVRNKMLHAIVNMRSQDAVLGFSYDVFTFSMVANMVRLLLANKGICVSLGLLHVNVGSFHVYEEHFDKASEWVTSRELCNASGALMDDVANLCCNTLTPSEFIDKLKSLAIKYKEIK